jgi:catechol 2,3-dioxygenase-like lactoylglutathione lyase family enzyme
MLSERTAFSSFSAGDIGLESAFYAETLGLKASEENGMLMLELAGGQRVLVYPKEDHQPATFTVLNFEVTDIEAAVDDLVAGGVSFERYDGFKQDERGIMREFGPPIAWFTDPAGNVLALIQTDAGA